MRTRLLVLAGVATVLLALVVFLALREAGGSSVTSASGDASTSAGEGTQDAGTPTDASTDDGTAGDSTEGATTPDDAASDGGTTVDPDDPIGLGYAFEDQPCSDSYLVVLASSGDPSLYRSTLDPALAAQSSAGEDPHYLRTDESCSTFNGTGADGDPIYAAYLGPYDDAQGACQARMDTTTPVTYVKSLDGGSKGPYHCTCAYDVSELPDLNTESDAESEGERRFWVVEVQKILFNQGKNPQQLIGGNFGPQTVSMLSAYQRDRDLEPTGAMDTDTWSQMQSDTCS